MSTPLQVIDDGQERQVNGRVAKMIRWLLANAPKVSAPNNLKLTFDCSGETVKATRQETETVDSGEGR